MKHLKLNCHLHVKFFDICALTLLEPLYMKLIELDVF